MITGAEHDDVDTKTKPPLNMTMLASTLVLLAMLAGAMCLEGEVEYDA